MRENYTQKDYTLPRLYVDAALAEGESLTLPKEQAHYLGTVLRKCEGNELRIFNGRDGEWRAEIAAISKATELGVKTLQPVITARTQFPKLNIDKARLQAIEAAEQTERLDIPRIEPVQKLDALLSNWHEGRALIFADEAGEALPALNALTSLPKPSAILIGPEGGFTAQERDILRGHSFVTPVSLGPRILRADTAALSLLTLWQAACGDWG